ncbi:MAG: dynamin family protein [Oligosphaeraceae bacterium]
MVYEGSKIGIVGGYISGKATFLNALMKAPYFEMHSNSHNHIPIEIVKSENNSFSWNYQEYDKKTWQQSSKDIRTSKLYSRIRVKIPHFIWGDTVFYDFPQINDISIWKKNNEDIVKRMDVLLFIFDAEYVMSSANKKILECLYPKNGKAFSIILNKSDIIDDISNLTLQTQEITPDVMVLPRIFTTSAKLELQRYNCKENRKQCFAFTDSRTQVMTTCDLAFSDLRIWLYEQIVQFQYTQS